jgi:hypothetical protein
MCHFCVTAHHFASLSKRFSRTVIVWLFKCILFRDKMQTHPPPDRTPGERTRSPHLSCSETRCRLPVSHHKTQNPLLCLQLRTGDRSLHQSPQPCRDIWVMLQVFAQQVICLHLTGLQDEEFDRGFWGSHRGYCPAAKTWSTVSDRSGKVGETSAPASCFETRYIHP